MMKFYLLVLWILCVGCIPSASESDNITIVTAVPTSEATPTITPQEISFNLSEPCSVSGDIPELDAHKSSQLDWITSDGAQLIRNETVFQVHGINYYPRLSPFELFLTKSEVNVIGKELDVIIASGINTLRIFVSFDQLFQCEQQAIPNPETFRLLDEIIQTIASKDLHIILVLHQDIGTQNQTSWGQLQFFVGRYAEEPAILAWDVLDKGDNLYEMYTPEVILTWLADAILAIRQSDSQHLITASWQTNTQDTIPLVDIVSFQHYGDYLPLRQEIANLKASTDKPIILSAIGYSTFDLDETAQRNLLFQAIEEVQNNDLAGWAIYMAFDYPTSVTCEEPNCPAPSASVNYYGIWNTSYFPKLAVDAVKRVTQTD